MTPTDDAPENTYHHEGDNAPKHGRHDEEVLREQDVRGYWRANLRLLAILLLIWFFVSFVLSIFLVDVLNRISFFGFKLGFWWAQQGAIYVFVGLVFYYAFAMKRIDEAYGVDDED